MMRIRLMMVVGIVVCGLGVGWSVPAQQNGTLPVFVPGQILTAADLNTVVEQVETNTAALAGEASGTPIEVDCDAGDSLAQALQGIAPGRTIQVSGTCTEQVTVSTDRLTLDGQGMAVLDGEGLEALPTSEFSGVLTIESARGVTVSGFTIRNGVSDGLVASQGAANPYVRLSRADVIRTLLDKGLSTEVE